MSSGSSNSSILNMPDYGQGLAEALQAQADALSGNLTGTPLKEIVERYERPLRMSAAQIDNDVLRQTLLGDRVPITSAQTPQTPVTADPLRPTPSPEPQPAPTTQIDYGGTVDESTGKVIVGDEQAPAFMNELREIIARNSSDPATLSEKIEDWSYKYEDDFMNLPVVKEKGFGIFDDLELGGNQSQILSNVQSNRNNGYFGGEYGLLDAFIFSQKAELNRFGTIGLMESVLNKDFTSKPIYRKNEDGTDFIVPKDDKTGEFILETDQQRRAGETTTQIDYGGTVDESTGKVIVGQGEVNSSIRDLQEILARDGNNMTALSSSIQEWAKNADLSDFEASKILESAKSARPDLQYTDTYFDGKTAAEGVASTILAEAILFNTTDVGDAISRNFGTPEPIYRKNPDGTDFVVPKDESGNFILEANDQSEVPDGGTLPTTPTEPTTPSDPTAPTQPIDDENITGYKRAGTGLVDMLGDKRMAIDPTTGLPTNREAGFDKMETFLD